MEKGAKECVGGGRYSPKSWVTRGLLEGEEGCGVHTGGPQETEGYVIRGIRGKQLDHQGIGLGVMRVWNVRKVTMEEREVS